MNENIQETAAAMLERIREKGWGKGNYVDANEHYCLRGSREVHDLRILNDVPFGSSVIYNLARVYSDDKLYSLLADTIREQFPNRAETFLKYKGVTSGAFRNSDIIVGFNDHPATTQADVELVLEKAVAYEGVNGYGDGDPAPAEVPDAGSI